MNDRPRVEIAPSLDVGLWRLGAAPLLYQMYTRATWIAMAQLIGLGAASASVTMPFEMSAEIVIGLALLAVAAIGFTLVQTRLVWLAATRSRHLGLSTPAWPARLVATLLLGMAGYLVFDRTVPSLVELWQITQGDNELRAGTMEVSPDGTQLFFDQTFATGTAAEFGAMLLLNPDVKSIRFRSPGGRVSEAYAVYQTIKFRGLDTVIDEICFSACTVAYLGGRQRVLHEGAMLGFHAVSFPGLTQADLRDRNRAMLEFLVRAGVQASFANRAVSTPSEELWLPSNDELLISGVVHKIVPASRSNSKR